MEKSVFLFASLIFLAGILFASVKKGWIANKILKIMASVGAGVALLSAMSVVTIPPGGKNFGANKTLIESQTLNKPIVLTANTTKSVLGQKFIVNLPGVDAVDDKTGAPLPNYMITDGNSSGKVSLLFCWPLDPDDTMRPDLNGFDADKHKCSHVWVGEDEAVTFQAGDYGQFKALIKEVTLTADGNRVKSVKLKLSK